MENKVKIKLPEPHYSSISFPHKISEEFLTCYSFQMISVTKNMLNGKSLPTVGALATLGTSKLFNDDDGVHSVSSLWINCGSDRSKPESYNL